MLSNQNCSLGRPNPLPLPRRDWWFHWWWWCKCVRVERFLHPWISEPQQQHSHDRCYGRNGYPPSIKRVQSFRCWHGRRSSGWATFIFSWGGWRGCGGGASDRGSTGGPIPISGKQPWNSKDTFICSWSSLGPSTCSQNENATQHAHGASKKKTCMRESWDLRKHASNLTSAYHSANSILGKRRRALQLLSQRSLWRWRMLRPLQSPPLQQQATWVIFFENLHVCHA